MSLRRIQEEPDEWADFLADRWGGGDARYVEVHNHGVGLIMEADALRAEVRRLREALEGGAPPVYFLESYLDWVADRFVHMYGESPNVDFVRAARRWAEKVRTARNVYEVKDER